MTYLYHWNFIVISLQAYDNWNFSGCARRDTGRIFKKLFNFFLL